MKNWLRSSKRTRKSLRGRSKSETHSSLRPLYWLISPRLLGWLLLRSTPKYVRSAAKNTPRRPILTGRVAPIWVRGVARCGGAVARRTSTSLAVNSKSISTRTMRMAVVMAMTKTIIIMARATMCVVSAARLWATQSSSVSVTRISKLMCKTWT